MDTQGVINALLAMSNGQWPFTVSQVEDRVEITYNLADARWIEFYGVGGHKKALKIILKFDEAKKQVKYTIVEGEVNFKAGVPQFSWSTSSFRGQKWGFSASMAYGIKTDGTIGELYKYSVSYDALPNDVKTIIEPLGWTIVRDFSDPSTRIALFFAVLGGAGAVLTLIVLLLTSLTGN